MPVKENAAAAVNFRPAVTKRASEIIYEQVKEMILKGELNPGDRLPSERNMMEMFQRSRPTIREALRMLERTGYIRIVAGSNGAVVLEPDDKNIQQTMEDALQVGHISLAEMSEYRRISEDATIVWACSRRTDEDLAALRAQLDKMAACVEQPEEYIGMDPAYHGLLAKAAKNQVGIVMNKTFSAINQNFMRTKIVGMTPAAQKKMFRKVHEMHEEIYRAVQAGDEQRARTAMAQHLSAFETDLK
ncbi:MAG: FadR family transcriptional regulator [Faecalibacterium sp.]|nr:FadR family transcriptional regulator [Faecalibacterium sp.]